MPIVRRLDQDVISPRMRGEMEQQPQSIERQREIEAAVLAVLITAYPNEIGESEVGRELTSIESTPERVVAIGQAVEGLVEAGLVVTATATLQLTPPAIRAGELELGL
jgi:hypothetical protein